MAHYTDAQAKAILRDRRYWPARTQQWGVAKSGEFWIRSRPSDLVNNKRPLPKLVLPGADLFFNSARRHVVLFSGDHLRRCNCGRSLWIDA